MELFMNKNSNDDVLTNYQNISKIIKPNTSCYLIAKEWYINIFLI